MKKPSKISLLLLLLGMLFGVSKGVAQTIAPIEKKQKTVVYKLFTHGAGISQATCDNIDKAFTAKTGVLSSKTNASKMETTVEMETEVPENDLKAIFYVNKIEVQKITVTDLTK